MLKIYFRVVRHQNDQFWGQGHLHNQIRYQLIRDIFYIFLLKRNKKPFKQTSIMSKNKTEVKSTCRSLKCFLWRQLHNICGKTVSNRSKAQKITLHLQCNIQLEVVKNGEDTFSRLRHSHMKLARCNSNNLNTNLRDIFTFISSSHNFINSEKQHNVGILSVLCKRKYNHSIQINSPINWQV